ncbi:MAG: serine hydrolase [Nitrososphaerota archaeon]|jgi:CubicO group peptidase (beta-lactamase class C family)|nr:serine hydrolase [Nitrososphaerota archaeon]
MVAFDIQRFDDLVFAKMSETKIPSVSAAVIEGGRVVHARGFGWKDASSASPATVQTLYGIGSITKSFVALAVGKLVESGKMDFHDPVTKFLPLKQKAFEGVEVHHLLSHTSGIPGLGSLEVILFSAFREYHHWLPIASLDDMSSFLDDVDDWVVSKPGTRLHYLNEGFLLLGEIVSKVSGRHWFDYLRTEVLAPLAMKRTFLAKTDVSADIDVATPYAIRGAKLTPTPVPYGSGAAGGIMSCAADLSRYVVMLIDGGEFEGKKVVSGDILSKMETPYAKWPVENYGGDSYGYGMMIIPDFRGHKVVRHGGSVDVYTSDMEYVRDIRSGVVLLSNGTGYSMGLLGMSAVSLLAGGNPEELRAVKLEKLLKKVEGQYGAYKGTLVAEVKKVGSFLILSGEDIGDDIVLVPDGEEGEEARFFTLEGAARVEVIFRFDQHGVELFFERYRYRRAGPTPPRPETTWPS